MSTTPHGQPAPGTRERPCARCGEAGCRQRCGRCASSLLLRKFEVLPKRFAGRELLVRFKLDYNLHPETPTACRALDLPLGETASCSAFVSGHGDAPDDPLAFYGLLYAVGTVAEELLDLPQGVSLLARARTLFGVGEDENDSDKQIVYSGLRLMALLDAHGPAAAAGN